MDTLPSDKISWEPFQHSDPSPRSRQHSKSVRSIIYGDGPILAEAAADDSVKTEWGDIIPAFLRAAGSNTASMIFCMVPEFINVLVIGQYGTVFELAAVGLGNCLQNAIGLSICFGLNMAFDNLVSTGNSDKKLSIVYLIRGSIVTTAYFFMITPVFWYSEYIFLLCHQDPKVALFSSDYNRATLIGLWFLFQGNGIQRFIQNQGGVNVVAFVSVILIPLHALWCYIFVAELQLGNIGVGLANSTTWIIQYCIFMIYLAFSFKKLEVSLKDFARLYVSARVWRGMGRYLKVAIPCAITLLSEWSWWEILTLIVGLIGEIQLAAHTSAFNILALMFMLPMGTGVTTSYFMGSAIGVGNALAAKRYQYISIIFFTSAALVCSTVIYITLPYISAIYSTDVEVQKLIVVLVRIYAFTFFPDGLLHILCSMARVCNRQNVAAATYVLTNYVISFGLTLLFGFYFHQGVVGVWWASLVGCLIGFLILAFYVSRLNIDDEIERAQARMSLDALSVPSVNSKLSRLISS